MARDGVAAPRYAAAMADDAKQGTTDRKQTDDSLRTERENVDKALRARQSDAERDADLVVARARKTADAVLDAARDEADEGRSRGSISTIAATRAREDAAVHDERASADAALERERAASHAALARLLPLERETTDRFLLTERIRSDTEVAHRDDFLGIVSHDLRNLLSGIAMSATLLIERASTTDEGARATEAATRIQHYSARMNRLIGDLLDVASMDAGKLLVIRTPGDLATVIDEAIDLFRAQAVAKNVAIENLVAERPQSATFDHDRMIQVLANLITNAIKFTAPGGTISVTNGRTTDGMVIAVRDTGIGISQDKFEKVFERFWQAGKQNRKGVGLGLYISKCIVEAHGGRIWVESKPGAGSTFSFSVA
jgi:signal transduction histidine kinase